MPKSRKPVSCRRKKQRITPGLQRFNEERRRLMSKMSAQQLVLSWKDHNSTLVSVFENLLKKSSLVDCTLAAEGQYLKAHKLVLSACSSYFELLFSQESGKEPIVILKDVKFQELEAAVNFMYRGEVEVSQDRLAAFLEVAESLQIKGLGSIGHSQITKEKSSAVICSSAKSVLTQRQQSRKDNSNSGSDNSDQNSNVPADCEHTSNNESSLVHQSFQRGSSPALTASTLRVGSSCTIRKETHRDLNSLEDISQSSAIPFTSGESVQIEVNPIIKVEPSFEDQSDEAGREFEDDVTMMGGLDEGDEPNTETMDVVPTNQQDFDAGWTQPDDQPKFASVYVKEEPSTLASWNQLAVAYGASASGDGVEPSAGTSGASADAGGTEPEDRSDFMSVFVKEEHDLTWNQEAVAYDVSTSGDGVEPNAGTSAASAGADSLVNEDNKLWTPVSDQFHPPVSGINQSSVSGKSTDTSMQQTSGSSFKKIYCPVCNELFVRMMDLEKHMRSENCGAVPSVSDVEHPPADPFQPLKLQELLQKPLKRRAFKWLKKPFKCPHCNYESGYKGNMVVHIRTHTGEKPFHCPHCNFKSPQKGNMLQHLRTHTGEKPFKCPHCEYASSRKEDLTKHVRLHTGDKPFKCPHCDYASRRKDDLAKHVRLHTGEKKAFKCPHCNFACGRKGNLVSHISTHR